MPIRTRGGNELQCLAWHTRSGPARHKSFLFSPRFSSAFGVSFISAPLRRQRSLSALVLSLTLRCWEGLLRLGNAVGFFGRKRAETSGVNSGETLCERK